ATFAKGMQLQILNAGNESELDAAFAQWHAEALVSPSDTFFNGQHVRIVALVARAAVPAIYDWREYVTSGGLVSYGASLTSIQQQLGSTVGKILKGAKPADLPVQQPTKFELVINLKTAMALGLR